jgi:hypothetical protein
MTAEEFKQGTIDTFLRIADRFGVPCVILAAAIYFGREAAVALHSTVIQPVVKSHVQFLETTSDVQQQQARTLEELASGQIEIKAALTRRDGTTNIEGRD